MKSFRGPGNPVIGCWTRSEITLVYTKEKLSEGPWSRGFQKTYLKTYNIHPLKWSNGFCDGRGKRGALVENNRDPWPKKKSSFYNNSILNIPGRKRHNTIQIHKQCWVGLTMLCGRFPTFKLNVKNILWKIVNPTKHCYGSESCYGRWKQEKNKRMIKLGLLGLKTGLFGHTLRNASTFTHFLVRGRASFTAPLLSLGLPVTCGILDLCFYTVFLIEPHTDSYDSLSNPTTSEDNVSPNSCRSESWFTSWR
jgi:hypothetical protein